MCFKSTPIFSGCLFTQHINGVGLLGIAIQSNEIRATLRDAALTSITGANKSGSTGLQLNKPIWLAYTWNATTQTSRLTLNNVEQIGTNANGVISSGNFNSVIGGRNNTQGVWNGIIDEPRIWNRALTATEVANMYYNNIVPRDGLVGEWLFNEGSGTTALDTAGNNPGTITGATYTDDVPLKIRTTI